MPVRPRFDPKRALIAARGFSFLGRAYALGDPFPHPEDTSLIAPRLLSRQYESHAVNFAPLPPATPDELVTMTGPSGGRYTINAPWLERPLVIRGKVNAGLALAEMRKDGPPLGWIDGGTDVDVEELGGGWYAISAPWLDEPEKVQGREDAEARQREIHAAGDPADQAPGDEVEVGDVSANNGTDDEGAAPDGQTPPNENAAKAETTEGEGPGDLPAAGPDDDVAADSVAAGKPDEAPASA